MRRFGILLLIASVACGCNADPRCRRETALLRAEILDLEDKLVLARSRGFASSETMVDGEVIISDPTFAIPGETTVYGPEIEITPPPRRRLFGRRPFRRSVGTPLEVQHEIITGPVVTTPAIGSTTTESFDVLVNPPANQPFPSPSEPVLDIQLPAAEPLLSVPPTDPLPAPSGSGNNPRPRPRPASNPEIEIALDDFEQDNDLLRPQRIARVSVNRRASKGQDVDGRNGDEGLNLLIQPRSADGAVVMEAGRLEIDLIDPTGVGDRRQVGHWEFVESETELFFARDRAEGEGILLHLPWEQNTPQKSKLLVSVRFTDSTGQQFDTSSEIEIDPPTNGYSVDDPLVTGWTQRDTRWEIGTNNQRPAGQKSSDRWEPGSITDRSRQYAGESASEYQQDSFFGKRRVKAIPASTSRPASERPSWRPVR